MNIETWGYIRHLFFVEKLAKKVIARQLNLDPKTVRRALAKETFSNRQSLSRPSKLDPFREKIAALMKTYPGISVVRIHEEIRKGGYDGGISILRTHVRSLKPEKQAFLYIRTLPGEEAQVDWASTGRIGDRKSSCFLMVLSFSKMIYIEFFPSQSLENFLAGHVHAFHYFQGIPRKIRYDNLKSVVLNRLGPNIQFNRRFLDFAAHYLFDPSVCNVRSPQEKGRVENAVKYVKNNFLAARTFGSLADCNQQAADWRDHTANVRIHGSAKARPIDLFREKEQSALISLPRTDYDTRMTCSVKSSSQCLVRFDTNRYSVPFPQASMLLTLKADDQFVSIYDKERLIAEHARSYDRHQVIENPEHVKGLLGARPQGAAFKHRDAICALGESAGQYLDALAKTELRLDKQFQKILDLIDLFGKSEVAAAIEHALQHGAFGHEYLRNIILANRRARAETKPPGTPSSKINPDLIRTIWVEERNPEIYDQYCHIKEEDDEDPKP
ncbi:MAG: Integrase core domain protein [Syntrophus sp. PtaB.Bin138]|jgi:transposase|nr:MAG: Integrase core domain protein [Syntrophus sp. PtaB.Bin138]